MLEGIESEIIVCLGNSVNKSIGEDMRISSSYKHSLDAKLLLDMVYICFIWKNELFLVSNTI